MKTSSKIEIIKSVILQGEDKLIDDILNLIKNKINFSDLSSETKNDILKETDIQSVNWELKKNLILTRNMFKTLPIEEQLTFISFLNDEEIEKHDVLSKKLINYIGEKNINLIDSNRNQFNSKSIKKYILEKIPLIDLHKNYFNHNFLNETFFELDHESKKSILERIDSKIIFGYFIKRIDDEDFYLKFPQFLNEKSLEFNKEFKKKFALNQDNRELLKEILNECTSIDIFKVSYDCFKSNYDLFEKKLCPINYFRLAIKFDDIELFRKIALQTDFLSIFNYSDFVKETKFLKCILENKNIQELLKNNFKNFSIESIKFILENYDIDTTLLFYSFKESDSSDKYNLLLTDSRTFIHPTYFRISNGREIFYKLNKSLNSFFKEKVMFETINGIPNRKIQKNDILISLVTKNVYKVENKNEKNELVVKSFEKDSEETFTIKQLVDLKFSGIQNPNLNNILLNVFNINLKHEFSEFINIIENIDSKIQFLKDYQDKFIKKINEFDNYMTSSNDFYFKNILSKNYKEISEKIVDSVTEIEKTIEEIELKRLKESFDDVL